MTNKCKICGKETEELSSIYFRKVFICNDCSNCIVQQQVNYLIEILNKVKKS